MPEAGCVEENASLQSELGSRFKCSWVPKAALPASNGSNSGSSLAMLVTVKPSAAGQTSEDSQGEISDWWLWIFCIGFTVACAMEKWKSWLRVQQVFLNTMVLDNARGHKTRHKLLSKWQIICTDCQAEVTRLLSKSQKKTSEVGSTNLI